MLVRFAKIGLLPAPSSSTEARGRDAGECDLVRKRELVRRADRARRVACRRGDSELWCVRHRRHAMNMRLLFLLCVVVASAMSASSAWAQDRPPRVALLIGNASYPDASTPLSTTIRDARTLADEFRRFDFEVDLKENVGKEDMRAAIDAFLNK